MVDRCAKGYILTMLIHKKLDKAGGHGEEAQHHARRDEGEEESIVALPNAIVDPHAVVVMTVDAVVAESAVMPTRRSPDVTGPAMFDWHLHSSRFRLGRLDQSPVISARTQP